MHWSVLGESVIGSAHRARSIPCQDAFRFRRYGPAGDWLVLAVADGAGSASHSHIGATRACDEFVERVAALGSVSGASAMRTLFAEVRSVLVGEAERLDVRPRELACTALLAIIGPGSIAVAQIGDGAIIIGDGQEYRAAFWPEPTEYANTTDFLTDERFADTLRFEDVTGTVAEVALMTDGLQRLALDFTARTPHAPFFRPLFTGVRTAVDFESLVEPFRAFLDSPRINERTDDDKTLVLAISRP